MYSDNNRGINQVSLTITPRTSLACRFVCVLVVVDQRTECSFDEITIPHLAPSD